MKNWFLLALVFAALAAGIWLLWFEDGPSTELANTAGAEARPQLEPEKPRLSFDQGERGGAEAQKLFKGRKSPAMQVNSPAPDDVLASRPLKPDRVSGSAFDFPDDEDSEEFVIGGHVQDEEGNPLSHIKILAEWTADSDGAPLEADLVAENVQSVFSDSDGAFLLSKLEDGEYRVRLAPVAGVAPAEVTVRVGTLNVNLVVVMLRGCPGLRHCE